MINAPNGCAACGHVQRGHYRRWHETVGTHQWLEPSNAQRLARMRINRMRMLWNLQQRDERRRINRERALARYGAKRV